MDDARETGSPRLTEAQEALRARLGAETRASMHPDEVFLYRREADGTTRLLVTGDGRVVEKQAWLRADGPRLS